MSVYEKLLKIQQETKCNKGQFNAFGKYKYRNVEDIWEAVKPVAAKYGAVLTCTDTITHIGDRYYVEAVAVITDVETGDAHCTKAYAREDETKKGMDGSQITGTASSYARKYAMGGLLGLDDTKDADYNKGIEPDQEQPQTGDRSIAIKSCVRLAEQIGETRVSADGYNGKPWDDLTDAEIAKVKVWLVALSKKA